MTRGVVGSGTANHSPMTNETAYKFGYLLQYIKLESVVMGRRRWSVLVG